LTEPPRNAVDTVEVAATPEAIWGILDDPTALGRLLPGCESIVREAPDRFSAVVASKVRFMTVRSDVVATLLDADPPRHLRLVLEGRPRGLGGSFRLDVPFDIAPTGPGLSSVSYSVGLELGGSLKGFGGPTLTEALHQQVGELVKNIEQEVERGPSPGSSGSPDATPGS
jgi:carbon monoxide dehydrogenase subunit G